MINQFEIKYKDLEVVKIKENIKSNKEEIQRVKILNKDITQRYTDKFNMANRQGDCTNAPHGPFHSQALLLVARFHVLSRLDVHAT